MSKNAAEIRSEIEQTRGAMGSTLEALGDRVAPKKVAARAKADVAEKVEVVRHRLSPVGAIRRATSRMSGSMHGAMSAANGPPRSTAGARSALSEAPGKLADKAGSATETVTQQASGNPLAVGLLAFGAGVAVAGLLPPTDRERQVAGKVKEKVEPLKDQALEAGRSIMGELKPAAQAGVEQVKERAVGAVEQVKGEARGAAGELKEGTQTTAQQVKQTTRAASSRVRAEARSSTATVKSKARSSANSTKQAVKRTASSSAPKTSGRKPATRAATPRSRSTRARAST